ncbi:MAG TPA: DUF6036 family nucleotidyltransferase [Pirellulaceae bacterium]|nr:DUF6036 family nucleotidyltransferase [Pirellulaceae bacterium]
MVIVEEMLAAANALNQAGLDYAICGGFAVIIHGYSRLTKDIDFLVHPNDVERIVVELAKLGFDEDTGTIVFRDDANEPQPVRRVVKFSGNSYLIIDLIHVTPKLSNVWETRQPKDYEGGQLTTVSLEGLRIMKMRAGRTQDLLDIQKLEQAHEEPMDEP